MNEPTKHRIDMLRTKLYRLAEEHHGNLLHPQVIAASQRLDVEIADILRSSKVTNGSTLTLAV